MKKSEFFREDSHFITQAYVVLKVNAEARIILH